jgi:hypothetical protein
LPLPEVLDTDRRLASRKATGMVPRNSEILAREVPALLVSKELLSPEWAERILSWRHTGFNVHSRVRTPDEGRGRAGGQVHGPLLRALRQRSQGEGQPAPSVGPVEARMEVLFGDETEGLTVDRLNRSGG